MLSKAFSTHTIRRAALGTCVVLAAESGAAAGARPHKVTITLLRRRGCWRAHSSRGVAAFAFPKASGLTSVTAPLDLEYLFRCSGKPDAEVMQIKICVAYCRGATRKARVSLEEFLEALLPGHRAGSFYLYIYEDKVGLQLASQQFQGLPTTWPMEQKPGKGKTAMSDDGNTDAAYNEWQVCLDSVFAMEDDTQDADDEAAYYEWKAYLEKVFAVEDHDAFTDYDDYTEKNNLQENDDFVEAAPAEEEEAFDVAAAEEQEASAVAATQEEAGPVTVPAAPATESYAYRSLTVAQRFISRLAGPSDRQLQELQVSHGVSIVRVRRTLHIKGHRDAVLRCHRHIRDTIAEWRGREAAEAH